MRKFNTLASGLVVCTMLALMVISCSKKPNEQVPDPIKPGVDTVYSVKTSVDTLNFELEGGEMAFNVIAQSAGWDLVIVDGEDWLTADVKTAEVAVKDSISTTVKLTAQENLVEVARVAYVLITQKETGKTARVGVSQAAAPVLETSRLTDSLALLAVYEALDGISSWPNYWNLEKPMNTWKGIGLENVNGEQRVTKFDFRNLDAMGVMPAELGNLRELKALRLTVSGRVKGVIPEGLSFARNMVVFDIRDCSSITAIPKNAGFWTNLEDFIVDGSAITKFPASMASCTNLRTFMAAALVIKGGKATGNVAEIFKGMDSLRIVVIDDSDVTGNLSFLRNKKILKEVTFGVNKLSGDLDLENNFVSCPSLEALTLDESPEITGTLKGIEKCPSITSFSIIGAKIGGDISEVKWGECPKLYSKWFADCELTGNVPLDLIKGDVNMFNFSGNKLSGTLSPEVLVRLKELFISSDRLCVQKEGFGFTNCDLDIPVG